MGKQKKIIIWTKGLDDFLNGEKKFNGGIAVQMTFWAKTFVENNWEVYSISENKKTVIENIRFFKIRNFKKIGIITDFLYAFFVILKIKPDLIINRGSGRTLGIISLLSKIFAVKLVLLAANDKSFIPGQEKIKGNKINTQLYQTGIKKTKYFVVQNKYQKESLWLNYKKQSIIISNIWDKNFYSQSNDFSSGYILWVANFRNLKRPEWFINLARHFPNNKFVMIGFPNKKPLYEKSKNLAKNIRNLEIIGGLPFAETNSFFAKAKVFVCTSEYEGFPNTFLQAWSNNIPVISTVDPSDLIKEKKLGVFAKNEDELKRTLKQLIENKSLYHEIQINIDAYFSDNHDTQQAYYKLLKYIQS